MRDNRRARVLLTILLLAAFTLVTLDMRGTLGVGTRLRGLGQTVFGPMERAATAVSDPVGRYLAGLTQINANHQRIADLTAENARLRQILLATGSDRRRAQEVDDLLHLAGSGQYKIVPAQVVALSSSQGFAWTATVDAGTRDGVTAEMTVVNGQGLVGRVISAGPGSCTVLLMIDPSFNVGARLAGSGEIGNVEGHGRQPAQLVIYNNQAVVNVGDQVVTLGSVGGRPFVPGVPIGTLSRVQPTPGALSRSALLTPFVDFTSLDIVGIVVEPPRTNPRDSVLPPVPSPSDTGAPPTGSTTPTPSGSSS
jgi:rod shape-determining protein MreC